MVHSLLTAVTKQLGTTFGTSYHYYVEDVKQGIAKPCFTIDTLMPITRSKSAVLYDRTIPVVIHYFGDSKDNLKNDCYDKGEQIIECLEYLPFKSALLRGEDISFNIVDEVLQVFITYRFTTTKVTPLEDGMETFDETIAQVQ